jgi:hypothetical protein
LNLGVQRWIGRRCGGSSHSLAALATKRVASILVRGRHRIAPGRAMTLAHLLSNIWVL